MASRWESQPWTAATAGFDVRAEASIPADTSIDAVIANNIGEVRSLTLSDGVTDSTIGGHGEAALNWTFDVVFGEVNGFDPAEHEYTVTIELRGGGSNPTAPSPRLGSLTVTSTEITAVPYSIRVHRDDTGERLLLFQNEWTGGTDTVDVDIADPDVRSDVYTEPGYGVTPYGETDW